MASGTAKGLVGRGTELATLVDRLTCDGGPTGVVLHGEPGVGKTALLAAIGAAAEGTGCIVLQGRCIDIGESWPYHPLRDAMREAACVSVEPVRSLLDGLQQDLATPSTAPLLERLHRGMLSLTERAPVVLIFDDFQWADRGTARLALTLLSEQRGPRLRLVASVRTEDVGRTTRLNEAFLRLRRAGVLDVLSIAPLDFDATVELANRVRGDQLMPAEARTLWNRTEGNPFLIGELALAPLEGGAPRTFKDLVLSRLASCSPDERMLVRIICVGADGLSHQHLLRLLDCSEDELLLRVRAVTESSLVKECGTRYVPRHGLLREVVNDDMLHAERQTLHRRIARILADDGQVLARELAYHWRAAGENALAVEAGILAAQQAADANAWVDGWREWRLVVAELESGPLSASYLLAAAHAAHQAGQDLSAIDLIRRVERMDPTEVPLDAIQIKLRRAEYLAAAGQLADAASFYRGILAEMRADSEILSHVRTLYGEVLLRVGEIAEAQRMAELALANVVNKQTEVAAHRVLALCCLRSGRPMEAKSHLERALAMATETHDAGGIGAVSLDLANLLGGVLAELEEGVSVARVGALAVLDARGALIIAIKLRAAEMKILFRLGRWQEAAEVARQTMRDDPTGSAGADALLAHIRVRLAIGDLQSAERDLRRAATLLADRAHDPETVTLAILRAGYFMWCNDPISARNIVAICMNELDGSEDDATIATLLWHGIRAEAEACAAGMKADDECLISLAQLNDRLRAGIERALEPPSEVLLAYEDLYDAELSRVSGHSDPALWEAAARRWELNGHPYPAAYSYLRQAEAAFARRTRNADAAAALRHAAALAMKLEARPLLELIMDLADRARVKLLDQPRGPEPTRVPSARADGLALLTDREREVVEHVARGMSNRQIGKALFISPGTVAAHVTHCLRKLDVGTRVELAAMLVRSTTSHD